MLKERNTNELENVSPKTMVYKVWFVGPKMFENILELQYFTRL